MFGLSLKILVLYCLSTEVPQPECTLWLQIILGPLSPVLFGLNMKSLVLCGLSTENVGFAPGPRFAPDSTGLFLGFENESRAI